MNKLRCALVNSYCQDTAYELVRSEWTSNNRTLGHCAVVALIVNDYFGGTIRRCIVGYISHYFNEVDGIIVDLTCDQFGFEVIYDDFKVKTREELLSNTDTKNRYKLLSLKVKDIMKKLDCIDSDIEKCNKCNNLVEKFTNETSISYGKNTDIIILGEAPANNGWRKSGKAWFDVNGKMLQSGKILDRLLNIIDVSLEDTTFVEAIKCFPMNRKYLKECNLNCRDYLFKQLELLNPKLIISLGDSATKMIIDTKYKKFGDIAGVVRDININGKDIKVLPIYHPSPISPISYSGNVPIFINLREILQNKNS